VAKVGEGCELVFRDLVGECSVVGKDDGGTVGRDFGGGKGWDGRFKVGEDIEA